MSKRSLSVDPDPKRRVAYIERQAGAMRAIFKAFAELRDQGIVLPSEMITELEERERIRQLYPKR